MTEVGEFLAAAVETACPGCGIVVTPTTPRQAMIHVPAEAAAALGLADHQHAAAVLTQIAGAPVAVIDAMANPDGSLLLTARMEAEGV
jgi:hypothetical protein